jgi:carboxypeptidase C (cathepsin A)
MMKLTTASFAVLLLTQSVLAEHNTQHLRQAPAESSCNKTPNQAACFAATDDVTGTPCEWCVAGAIPSECMSRSQAKNLPGSVFQCSSPGFDFAGKKHALKVKTGDSDICDSGSKSISGYMDISGSEYDRDGENKHLFFWMFEKRGGSDANTPFVVWLTGGPGCSSTLALLSENGPCKVNKDGESTAVNPYSWTESANVLWLGKSNCCCEINSSMSRLFTHPHLSL